MLAIFKRRHLRKVLAQEKTQTRRTHRYTLTIGKTYAVRDRWFSKPQGHIIVTRKFRQRLGDISPEDVKKEGFSSLEEFKKEWKECYGPESWNPDQIVMAYEFKLKEDPKNKIKIFFPLQPTKRLLMKSVQQMNDSFIPFQGQFPILSP